MILHNKAWFLLCARHTKGDSVSYYTIKNITRFDTALKHYIIRRNSNIMPILSWLLFNVDSSNWAQRRLSSETKKV